MAEMTDQTLEPSLIEELRTAFDIFDKNKDGTICIEEIKSIFEVFEMETTDEQVQKLMKENDIDGSGGIEFKEFLTLMTKKYERRDKSLELRKVFQVFDIDNSGTISADELRESMAKLGETLSVPQVNEMIEAADSNGDGEVDYEEFIKMMEKVS